MTLASRFSLYSLLLLLACGGNAMLASADACGAEPAATPAEYMVYVGTYTGPKSKGIYSFKLDMKPGQLTSQGVVEGVVNPSFLAIHPSEKFLYSVCEIGNFHGKRAGGVSAFAVHADGSLTLLNQQSSVGAGPCHLTVDATGKNILVANYGGGSVASLPIDKEGKLRPHTAFIQHEGVDAKTGKPLTPHAHSVNLDAANRFACVADLGLNKILVYKFDADKGTLTLNDAPLAVLPPNSGPRHLAFHPNGKFAYVINEQGMTVTALAYDAEKGQLTTLQTIDTIPAADRDQIGLSTAEVRVHPSGKFVYGSNRGHDTIVVFAIDPKTGKLTYVENTRTEGKTPRNFFIDPTGTYLLAENQNSDSIVVFRIDQETGKLTSTGHTAEVPSPVCIRMIPIAK
jgi:6-phosphogluconolactonase